MRHAPYSTFSDALPVPAPTPAGSRLVLVAGWLAAALSLPRRVAAIRRDMALLGRMSAAELSDIGLSRQDVHDAAALPLGRSPGALLTGRAAERRLAERQRRR